MPLKVQIYLQWFQFPEGVTFDGKEFRTTKISSLFKLKQLFLPQMSFNVHYSKPDYEHNKSSTSPPLRKKDSMVWKEVADELLLLQEKLKLIDTTPDQDDGPLSHFFSSSEP